MVTCTHAKNSEAEFSEKALLLETLKPAFGQTLNLYPAAGM